MKITENEFKKRFKTYIEEKGFRIVKEITNNPPDLIIEKDGELICVELKVSRGQALLGNALYQLLFARYTFKTKKLWLVISKLPTVMSRDWIKLLWNYRISIFLFDGTLKRIRLRNLLPGKASKKNIVQENELPIATSRKILELFRPNLLEKPHNDLHDIPL